MLLHKIYFSVAHKQSIFFHCFVDFPMRHFCASEEKLTLCPVTEIHSNVWNFVLCADFEWFLCAANAVCSVNQDSYILFHFVRAVLDRSLAVRARSIPHTPVIVDCVILYRRHLSHFSPRQTLFRFISGACVSAAHALNQNPRRSNQNRCRSVREHDASGGGRTAIPDAGPKHSVIA